MIGDPRMFRGVRFHHCRRGGYSGTRHPHLRRRAHARGPLDAELEQIVAPAAVAEKFIPGLRALRDQYADLIRSRYPNIPRRVSGYSLDELLPQRGFNVAKSLVVRKAPA